LLIGVVFLATARGDVMPSTSQPSIPQPQTRQVTPGEAVRFATFNLWLDAGTKPLAAYQVEVQSAGGSALLVGLEGGDPAAFRQPPYYDTRALLQERLIVAAFSTADDLPSGRFIAARLHLQITGDKDPTFEIKVRAAAGADGSATVVRATVERTP
jgi:hypothetical protein